MGRRRLRHDRPGGRAARGAAGHGGDRAAGLGRGGGPDVGAASGIGRLSGHGIPPGTGAPANLTLYDPAAAAEPVDPAAHASKSRNSPFRGVALPGKVVATFLRGTATVLDGKLAS